MVKIIDLEEDLGSDISASTNDDISEEEDDTVEVELVEKPPDLPLSPDTSTLELAPEERACPTSAQEGCRRRALDSGVTPHSLRDGTAMYLWALIAQYAHYVELQRSLFGPGSKRQSGSDGLSTWMLEYQQQANSPNGHSNQEFSCTLTTGEPDEFDATPDKSDESDATPDKSDESDSTPDKSDESDATPDKSDESDATPYQSDEADTTPDKSVTPELPEVQNSVDNGGPERAPDISNTETACQTEEAMNEGKTDSDEPAKEKNSGVDENVQFPVTAATDKVCLAPRPPLSNYELSDDTLQAESRNKDEKNTGTVYTTSLTDCPWTTVRESCRADQEPSECSEDGESACLPAHSIVKDCWEQWVDDDRLFNLSDDMNAASTSAGVRWPSPGSLNTERRRDKFENRQRIRELERTSKPQLERFIFAPTGKIGRILGKRGRRIREIEKTSGAAIKIERRQSNKPVTQISISGTEEQISKADKEICIIIRNFKPPKETEAVTVSVTSREEMELRSLLLGIKNQVIDAKKRFRKS